MSKKGNLFVLSAASGAGKTTLKDKVLPKFPNLVYSISATTRPQRPGEINGVHYHFKSTEAFESLIQSDALVEYNRVHNNYYGTPKSSIFGPLKEGKSLILDLDVYGKINFDRHFPEAIGILIVPPSFDTLKQRLIARKSDTPEVIELRLSNAKKEMEFAETNGNYKYTIVNDSLSEATKQLTSILDFEMNSNL